MKKQNNGKTAKATVPGEWLYLAKAKVSVREIADALPETYEIEIWEEAGVLEIMIREGVSVDIEHVKIHPKDELTCRFVGEMGYEEVFLVTFAPEEYDCVKKLMQQIMSACGGMFCGDTEDFSPIMRGE